MRIPAKMKALPFTLIALLFAMACSDSTGASDQGNVRVVLRASDESSLAATAAGAQTSDDDDDDGDSAPLSSVEEANITFSSMLARNTDGQLIDLGLDLPQTIDVKALMNGNELTLPAGSLPAGDYDQLVVVMTQVELVFANGGAMSLTPPGGGWTSIVRVAPFTVVEGEELTVELNLRLRGAFKQFGSGFRFFPDFDGRHHHDD